MISSINTGLDSASRSLLLELLASKTKDTSYTTSNTTSESTQTTGTQEMSFEDLFQMMQSNGTGHHKGEKGLSSSVDTDGDGTLSTDEYDLMIDDMGVNGAMSAADFFSQYDSNGDGEITKDEMPEPGSIQPNNTASSTDETLASQLFSQYDTDGDGTISADEFSDMISSLQRMAESTIRAYEENYNYMYSSDQETGLNSIV